MILAIDPGCYESAYCLIDTKTKIPVKFGKVDNEDLLLIIEELKGTYYALAIEMVASYGMRVGSEIFETCVWIGRFYERAITKVGDIDLIYRKDVKKHFGVKTRSKEKLPNADSQIRTALINQFGEVGTSKDKGYFYGFKADIWSAYAVGITYIEEKRYERFSIK